MYNLKILCTVLIVGCMITELKGQCTTPSGGPGQCKSINTCEPLFPIVNKPNRTPQEIDLLRRSHCGFIGNSPAVCCPENQAPSPQLAPSNNRCTTPDRKPGQCIGLYSCSHITQMLLAKPVPEQNVQFVQNSRCNGPEQYSVCCGSPPVIAPPPVPVPVPAPVSIPVTGTAPNGNAMPCSRTVSSLPPDPNSPCCGFDASFTNKIVGGTEAAIDQFPWMVLIEYRKRDGQLRLLCGGSLISGRYVLTAAHCVVGNILKTATPTSVRLGEHNTTNNGPDCYVADCNKGAISIQIEKIISHADYRARWNDIALIRIADIAPYNDFIRPICLPNTDISLTNSFYNLTVAGWGAVSERDRRSDVKLYVDLPYVNRNRCQQAYGAAATLRTTQLCAGGIQGKDSCKGDSGGPLMLEANRRNTVVGVVSFGHIECGLQNYPAVYTNVYQYLDWIRSNMER